MQRQRHEPLRLLQLIQSLVVHSAVPDAGYDEAELFLQPPRDARSSVLHVRECGLCAHLRDLQQLLGPVELFASGLADLDEVVDDFEDAVERVGRLLHEHLQRSAQTLLLGLVERAVLLLEEIKEFEIEREGFVALENRLHEVLQRRRVPVGQTAQLELQQRGLCGLCGLCGLRRVQGAQLEAQLLAALEHLQTDREVHAQRRRAAIAGRGSAGIMALAVAVVVALAVAVARNGRSVLRGGSLHLHPHRALLCLLCLLCWGRLHRLVVGEGLEEGGHHQHQGLAELAQRGGRGVQMGPELVDAAPIEAGLGCTEARARTCRFCCTLERKIPRFQLRLANHAISSLDANSREPTGESALSWLDCAVYASPRPAERSFIACSRQRKQSCTRSAWSSSR